MMLNICPQTYFLDSLVDDWCRRWKIWAENWFVDTNSARRNRCERSRKPPKGYPARLACWHSDSPNFGNSWRNVPPRSQTYENWFLRDQDWPKWATDASFWI